MESLWERASRSSALYSVGVTIMDTRTLRFRAGATGGRPLRGLSVAISERIRD